MALSYLPDAIDATASAPLSVARRRRGASMASRWRRLHANNAWDGIVKEINYSYVRRVRGPGDSQCAASSTLKGSLLPRLQNPEARRRDEVVVLLREVLAVLVVVDTFPLIALRDLLADDLHRFFRDDPFPSSLFSR